jgi:hypothetical protein
VTELVTGSSPAVATAASRHCHLKSHTALARCSIRFLIFDKGFTP